MGVRVSPAPQLQLVWVRVSPVPWWGVRVSPAPWLELVWVRVRVSPVPLWVLEWGIRVSPAPWLELMWGVRLWEVRVGWVRVSPVPWVGLRWGIRVGHVPWWGLVIKADFNLYLSCRANPSSQS